MSDIVHMIKNYTAGEQILQGYFSVSLQKVRMKFAESCFVVYEIR